MSDNQPGSPLGHEQYPQQPGQQAGTSLRPRKRHRVLRAASYAAIGGACLGIGVAIGSSWTIKAVNAL